MFNVKVNGKYVVGEEGNEFIDAFQLAETLGDVYEELGVKLDPMNSEQLNAWYNLPIYDIKDFLEEAKKEGFIESYEIEEVNSLNSLLNMR